MVLAKNIFLRAAVSLKPDRSMKSGYGPNYSALQIQLVRKVSDGNM